MKLVIFGLTISSSWGNGHATLWRALCGALVRQGHHVVFFERDQPYYAAHRDLHDIPGGKLVLYRHWDEGAHAAMEQLRDADVGITTSYCIDGLAAAELIFNSRALAVFYDLDTPITLARLRAAEVLPYIDSATLARFDLVLSFTGGPALLELRRLGARRAEPLYGSVDPEVHHPVPASLQYRADVSYLGTYSEDRQEKVNSLLLEPARRLPEKKFLIGGSLYPADFSWTPNLYFISHVPPGEHAAFYCSSRLALNVTRAAMAEMGYCPSGRLFEAAACGTPILSDWWEGLDRFFQAGSQIITAACTEDAIEAIKMSDSELTAIARAARERVFAEHTADHRAQRLITLLHAARSSSPTTIPAAAAEVK